MRLVNVHTLKLHEFFEGSIPPYAILSHRWTDEELTFKDLAKNRADVESKGFKKLLGACRIAANYKFDYVWMDTCCIDKRSSAELSESINSMFQWYRKAEMCLAYLEDVHAGPGSKYQFIKSVWFTRAWTLQELLAPRCLYFFDHQWTAFGSKCDLGKLVSGITQMPVAVIMGSTEISQYSVATRMSWASRRHATRPEDVAYSLLGIFDIDMPLLYGEGTKAFQRLQHEILRNFTEPTILCWGTNNYDWSEHHLLARSPADFRASGPIVNDTCHASRNSITNMGLEVRMRAIRWDLSTWGLLVADQANSQDEYMILVRKHRHSNTYYKTGVKKADTSHFSVEEREFYVFWTYKTLYMFARETAHDLFLLRQDDVKLTPIHCQRKGGDSWRRVGSQHESGRGIFWEMGAASSRTIALMTCQIRHVNKIFITFEFDFDGRPCCLIKSQTPASWSSVGSIVRSSLMRQHTDGDFGMTPIQGVDGRSWFLRARSELCDTEVLMPVELTGGTNQTWVAFHPPQRICAHDDQRYDQRLWWSFTIGHDIDEVRSAKYRTYSESSTGQDEHTAQENEDTTRSRHNVSPARDLE